MPEMHVLEDIDLISDDFNAVLPQLLVSIIEKCGKSVAVILFVRMAGMAIYVPSGLNKKRLANAIKNEFSGENASSLAVKYNIDRATVLKYAKVKADKSEESWNRLTSTILSVANICGEDVAESLLHNFPGSTLYVSSAGLRMLRKRYVLKNFTGCNVFDLAIVLGISDRYVRDMVAQNYGSIQKNHTVLGRSHAEKV